jgi:uncharacterized protein YecE (DUF72 family)
MPARQIVVATAGWSIPRAVASHFDAAGTHLQRYGQVLRGAEIDTSFYRSHSQATYARWAGLVPRGFRFAVKLPGAITHDGRLRAARRPLVAFLAEVAGLGSKAGPLIAQLPPSLAFERRVARRFFTLVRELHAGPVVCEPRHASWFESPAGQLLEEFHIGRVAADPAVVPAAALPGGWPGIAYHRLHGAPRMYWSVYGSEDLAQRAVALRQQARRAPVWCVFDNTASGAAMQNALELMALLAKSAAPAPK